MSKHIIGIDIGKIILQTLKEKDRSVAWLAKKIGCDRSNLRKTLKNSRFIYYDLIFQISEVLEVDFYAYGSHELENVR